jgi:DNA invertase Pin-like site-specific DNA recombinase
LTNNRGKAVVKSTAKQIMKGSTGWKLGYARVSTQDQNLALQIAALEKFGCNRIFQEKLSATARHRPELNRLWKELRPGDTLVIWKFDRLARNAREAFNRVHELEERRVALVSLTDGIDTTTAVGKLMLGVLAVMAQFERDLTSERTRAGIRRKQEDGTAHSQWTKKFDREVMCKALLSGETAEDFAKRHGVSKSAIYKAMDDELRRKLARMTQQIPKRRGRTLKVKRAKN